MSRLAAHRERRREAGLRRVEVQVGTADAERLRALARVLRADDARAARVRGQIDGALAEGDGDRYRDFKDWLSRMPHAEEMEEFLTRDRRPSRPVEVA
jgi:hypothetical protein